MIFLSIIAVIFLLVILSFVWPPDSPWSPWWRTNKKIAKAACRLAKITKKDIVYELGSGDGEFILTAAREFGCKRAVGIEIDYTRHIISKVKKRILRTKNAEFKREDFKKVKLNDATVVYFYLVPKVIERILPKLKKELKPGTRIVSLGYKTPLNLQKEDKENNLYSYIV